MRPSDSWAKAHTAPAYSSFPSDIRHTKTRQNLVDNNCDVPNLQQSQFEEVQLGMLLTGSSSGNVYRGMWRSIPVAVKVLQIPSAVAVCVCSLRLSLYQIW